MRAHGSVLPALASRRRDVWSDRLIRRVAIEGLAPTGEGVARSAEGVGFVAGALPGEDVDAEVLEVRKRFWKGRAIGVRNPSSERAAGAHAGGCAGCDWAHLELAPAREWKRRLFLETMERIGEIPSSELGEPPVAASPPAYRLRARFHFASGPDGPRLGYHAPRTHHVASAEGCLALSDGLRALLPRAAAALGAGGAAVAEIATLETPDASRRLARAVLSAGADRREANAVSAALAPLFDGVAVADPSGVLLARDGAARLPIPVGERRILAGTGAFFQSNRFLLEPLTREVAAAASAVAPGRALDLFGGVGLFAAALLEAGHDVTTVEGDQAAVDLALASKAAWGDPAWTIARSAALAYVSRETTPFDVAVVDPPRAGLGLRLAPAVAARVAKRLVYVSCDPATLARDLAALRGEGFRIASVRLFDLFALTHRVEAVVVLDRARR